VKNILKVGVKGLRAIAGENTAVEQFLRQQYTSVKSKIDKKYAGDDFTVFWSGSASENKVGIYMKGACDLVSIFSCTPMIHRELNGTCAIFKEGMVSDSRTDLLLQAAQGLPEEHVQPVVEKLELPDYYFRSDFLGPTFGVPGFEHLGEFPKNVVILSIAPDVVRTLYRHKEHGYLVDPGGWWLNQSIGKVLPDLSTTKWFTENFESVGRISIDDFARNFSKILELIKTRMDAKVLVLNALTVEPGNQTHNYQFVKQPHWLRRREFYLALVDLSRQLDFAIVDVDRILKKAGVVEAQVDFSHFPMEAYQPIAKETFRILKDLEVF
jgi:hypothetical protein